MPSIVLAIARSIADPFTPPAIVRWNFKPLCYARGRYISAESAAARRFSDERDINISSHPKQETLSQFTEYLLRSVKEYLELNVLSSAQRRALSGRG